MKKSLLVIAAFICSLQLFAQPPGGSAGQRPAGFSLPDNGHLFGKVVDSAGKAISEASVIVLRTRFDSTTKKSKDVLVKGTSTAGNGDFSMENLPMMGRLKLV
ncbi:MAG TPA: carboxypeptidase-like regulatory domain-containing protein, partial [Segetibacter sp.]|nr:carboxypeptidase-like regulatory domain-containing protein [Segetibacter sp.]